jgi:hypothetical protein
MTMAVLWDISPCSLVDTDRLFTGANYITLMMKALSCSETLVTIYQPTQ